MKKIYNNPTLKVVRINNNVIATSTFSMSYNVTSSDINDIGAPGQRNLFDEWNEGF